MKTNRITIGNVAIGSDCPPFIIAEMSGNHNQSLQRALRIVDAAAQAGVQALKIQTYTADTMTIKCRKRDFLITNPESLWRGKSLYELYDQAHTPWEWHAPIFKRCAQRGIIGFSTPFDDSSVDFLESMGVGCYKIASFENTDIPLIRRVASTGKPLIISTGMASIPEIRETVRIAKKHGANNIILLKCTSSYPAREEHSNLRAIPRMREQFGCMVGISDHTLGIGVPVVSIAFGACVVEKHFTLSRADGGVDAAFSLEPHEMKQLVVECGRARRSLGSERFTISADEKQSMQFRRSLYIVKNVKAGQILTAENMRVIRPGFGLAPKYYDTMLGRKARVDIPKGTALRANMVMQGHNA